MKQIIILTAIVILAGCAVGPKYARPSLPEPEAYTQLTTETDSLTNLKWWEVYQDTALQSLIRLALDSNLDMRTAMARVDEAKAILGYNKANFGPFINYSTSARSTDFGNDAQAAGVDFSGNAFRLTGNISWELDVWGKLRHANRAAFADMMANEEIRKSMYISVVAQVAELYFQLQGLDERLVITRRTYESRLQFFDIINQRYEKGDVSELDKLQAEQITAAAEVQLYSIERDIIATENALNVLLGRPYSKIPRGQPNDQQTFPLDIPSGLPSELLERRPDIRAAEQQLISQTERVGVAVALRFPSLRLTGFLGVASPEISSLFGPGAVLGSVSGQLAGPLFNWQQNKRRVDAERERAKQFAYQYEKTILTAFAEVENSLAEVRTYSNEFSARQKQVAATERSLLLSKALYDNGYTSFLQVLDAERELFDTELQKSYALQYQLISTVSLYKALGGGW
jgi:multidrug efflux system outer membrane protein